MAARVHITHPPDDFEPLKALLDPSIIVSSGEEYPEAGVDVIVSGRPAKDIPAETKMIVIPWAGIPEATLELVRSNPHIHLHNLHHNAPQVAELAVGLIFAATKDIIRYDSGIRKGDWGMRYQPTRATLLTGKTVLVLGYGAIGHHAAKILNGIGMRVIGMNRSGNSNFEPVTEKVLPISALGDILPETDVLLIALPLTEATLNLIDKDAIDSMPSNAYIINIGRGPIIDEWALYEALKTGKLGGAGLDVWWNYPPDESARSSTYPSEAPLHELDNLVMSPHRAGFVLERNAGWSAALASLLNKYARGEKTPNRVDINAGY